MSTLIELPTVPASESTGTDFRERDRLIRRAKALSWLSLAWMTLEGTVAIVAALAAGSVALLGFGIDVNFCEHAGGIAGELAEQPVLDR